MAVDREKKLAEDASQLGCFQKVVLGWDYVQILKDSTLKKKVASLKRVKDVYTDVADYIGTYEPLLFEEVKAHIVRGRDEEETDWQRGAVASCGEANGFHLVSLGVFSEFGMQVSENHLLLLSSEKFEPGVAPTTYGFGLVEFRQNHDDAVTLKIRTFLTGEVKQIGEDKTESSPRLSRLLSVLKADKSMLWVLKIASLSTIMREYVALHSIGMLPFKDLILFAKDRASDTDVSKRAWLVPKPLMGFLETNHNTSQLEAINAGLSRNTFILIQGPPGTGKTQTILGLLSAILHAVPSRVKTKEGVSSMPRRPELPIEEKYQHWHKSSPWLTGLNPRDTIMPVDGDDGFYPTTGNELKPEVVNSNRKYRVHVLVCAPSNSALDEIVVRVLNTGIRDENDHVYNPKIVRIGLKPHHSIQAVSMDYLVEQKLGIVNRTTARTGKSAAADRDRIRANILDESAIVRVFSTLSFSGSSLFTRMNRVFDVVIIDEAAQAVEPAVLVPLAHGCKQVYLVGDPVQLPATVLSSVAENYGYGVSLFKRFQKAGYPVQMLKTQYRMHPEIRSFPSKEFYSNSLDDGPNADSHSPWHDYRCFGPFCFFDVDGVESQPLGSGSWVNEDEVEFILLLYHKLVMMFPGLKSSSQLAIISPYSYQVKLFRENVREKYGMKSEQVVDINTVDGFQGREKAVAIFSCVRANAGKGIGFVSDFRRMNVGITRARSAILVVGSASTLMQDKHWSNLVKSAKERNCYFQIQKPYSSFFTESNMSSMRTSQHDYGPQTLDIEEDTEITMFNSVAGVNLSNEMDQETNLEDHDDMDVDGGYDED